jgi:hypothetical protein
VPVTTTTQSNTSNTEADSNPELDYFFPRLVVMAFNPPQHPLMPDDHSELVPPLPIPNRTVKRLHANDSADYPCESR